MVRVTDFFMTTAVFSALILMIFPLLMKIFVNNKIKKRHNCKLDVEQANVSYIILYSYFKYLNPGKVIGMAYIFNSQKMIDKIKTLKDINYNLKTAPKNEIFICVLCVLVGMIEAISLIAFLILTEILGVKP